MLRSLFILVFVFNCFFLTAQDAIYKIEFISNWSSTTHPVDYPSGSAHWSPLIGTTHQDAAIIFDIGAVASDGVEEVAETGGTSILTQEINLLITAGVANQVINGSGLTTGPGTITINNVTLDTDFPYISLITMIAPSPDWVAVIANQKLTDNTGDWLLSLSVDVYPTDAGTDSGTTYNSNDADVTPHVPISSLQGVAPFSNEIIGTFVFTREQILSSPDENLDNSIAIYPNPTNEVLYIKNLSSTLIEKAEIYSVNGKKLHSFDGLDSNASLTFNALTSGLYFVRLFSESGSLTTKKLVIR